MKKYAWDKLTDAQRDIMRKAGEQAEAEAVEIFAGENAKDTKRQADATGEPEEWSARSAITQPSDPTVGWKRREANA